MLKKVLNNCLIVILFASIAFAMHWLTLLLFDIELSIGSLFYSYSINSLMAIGVIILIFSLKRKLSQQLGFVFMISSLLKFFIFFLLFYPKYNADDMITKIEFVIFFIPYAVCLTTECVILSRFLNNLNTNK